MVPGWVDLTPYFCSFLPCPGGGLEKVVHMQNMQNLASRLRNLARNHPLPNAPLHHLPRARSPNGGKRFSPRLRMRRLEVATMWVTFSRSVPCAVMRASRAHVCSGMQRR